MSLLFLMRRSTRPSPMRILLTHPCICICETTNFLLFVSRGHSMIPYCCRCEHLIKMWDTEVRQVPCSQKYRCFNSHLVWCTHPKNRGPYGANLGTGLGTRWVGVYFGFPRSNDQFMGEALSSRYLLSYELYGCSGVGWKAA